MRSACLKASNSQMAHPVLTIFSQLHIHLNSMSLHRLPVELLQHICTFLQPSAHLQSFSLVNRKCHGAAISILFQSINLEVAAPDDAFELKMRSLTNAICSVGVENVHRLEIKCNQQSSRGLLTPENCILPEMDREWDMYSSPKMIWNDEGNCTRETIKWLPLARLIQRLLALSEFTWSHPARLPSSLLGALPRNCRLHLRMFCLGENLSAAHEYILDIAPVLSSVCVQFESPTIDDFEIPRAVTLFLEAIVGRAPRVREVRSCFQPGRLPARDARNAELDRALRLLAKPAGLPFEKLRGLTRLDLSGPRGVDEDYLREWMRVVDFVCLQTIRLSNLTDDALMWLRFCQPLTNLRVLMIHINRYPPPEEGYYNSLNAFITSLPPLQALLLQGQYSFGNVETIMQVHGPSLRKLWINPSRDDAPLVFNTSSIANLRIECPNLQDLRLTIRRTKGDLMETSIYNTLGSFPALTTLLLTLDCSNPLLLIPLPHDEHEPPFRAEMYPAGVTAAYPLKNRPTKSDIRDSLINAAIDHSLAHAIYNTISRAKSTSSSFPHLSHLILHPVGAGTFADQCTLPGLPECFSQLSQTFHIRRDWNGEVRIECDKEDWVPWRNEMRLQRALRRIFEGIWPAGETRDWRREWRSFPLCERLI